VVDSRSGTIRLKARFDNAAGRLWPGMYVNLRLQAGVLKQALLLPVGALQSGPDGKFAFVVGPDNQLRAQPLQLLAIRNEQAMVSGLPAGTLVVAAGGSSLRPGDRIKPKFVGDQAAGQAGARP
jgi:multidrug efflux pump subunit AcrA (membrane-fusion protein)